ncbi:TPA: hypothetical protein ACQMG2_001768, partial [Streptococcus pyogenes]
QIKIEFFLTKNNSTIFGSNLNCFSIKDLSTYVCLKYRLCDVRARSDYNKIVPNKPITEKASQKS